MYEGEQSDNETCVYHTGVPVFHEGLVSAALLCHFTDRILVLGYLSMKLTRYICMVYMIVHCNRTSYMACFNASLTVQCFSRQLWIR